MQNECMREMDQSSNEDEYYMGIYLQSEAKRNITACIYMLIALLVAGILAVVCQSVIPLSLMAGVILGMIIEHYMPLYDFLRFTGRGGYHEDQ